MLTERIIRDLKPGTKTQKIWDDQVKGLGVRCTPGGAKSYILFYRSGDRKHLATLGRTSELSLKAARERAAQELTAVRIGEPDLLERRQQGREAPTVAEGVARYFDEYVPVRLANGTLSRNTLRHYRNQADLHVLPALGGMKITDVTRGDVDRMASKLRNHPVQRNRTLAFVSQLFNRFEYWELRPQHSNPTRGIERAREVARDRVLSPAELAALAGALRSVEASRPASTYAIRVAALTGLRIGEVLAMKWEHVDFEQHRVLLPETKTGRRWHDLPAAVLETLVSVPRINGWIFTTGRDAAITYRTVRKHFAEAASSVGLGDLRLHDLRRTVMTRAAAAGVGVHVIRDLLGHKTTAMADRYVRSLGSPVREAREQVGGAIAAEMQGKVGEVIEFRKKNG